MNARKLGFEAWRQKHHMLDFWKPCAAAVSVLALTILLSRTGQHIPDAGPLAAIVLFGFASWWVWRWLLMPVSTQEALARRDDWMARNGGCASWIDILETAGPAAMRRRAAVVRPSLRALSWWKLRTLPMTEYAVPIATVGWVTVNSLSEMWTIRFGGPRMGKTGSLANHVLDAPGAAIITSTRPDLLELTGPTRAGKGNVHVFNPSLYGGFDSTVRWSLLVGCTDYATAQRRAADLIPESTGEAARWDDLARQLLALTLHAAALNGFTILDVMGWIAHASPKTGDEVAEHLRTANNAIGLMSECRSTFGTNDRTLSSITKTLMGSLSWVSDSRAAAIGDAPLDHPDLLDVEALVRGGRDSLYLISPAEQGVLAALTGALTAEIAHQARLVAGEQPSGRLDPPLTLVLDEAALTCRTIPLATWSSDMGGRGVTGHIAAQSLSQLRGQFGEAVAETLLTNCGTLIVLGGISGSTDLEKLSTLTGRRMMQIDDDDRRFVEVMAPAEISALPEGRALILRASLAPCLGDIPFRAWNRPDVKAAADTWTPRLVQALTVIGEIDDGTPEVAA